MSADELTKEQAIELRNRANKLKKALLRFLAAGDATVLQRVNELKAAVEELEQVKLPGDQELL